MVSSASQARCSRVKVLNAACWAHEYKTKIFTITPLVSEHRLGYFFKLSFLYEGESNENL